MFLFKKMTKEIKYNTIRALLTTRQNIFNNFTYKIYLHIARSHFLPGFLQILSSQYFSNVFPDPSVIWRTRPR